MPMSFTQEVSSDVCQNTLGLSPDDFNKYVVSAYVSTAAISTFAHEIALIQTKDANSAAQVKKLISGDGGFDSTQWICVYPDESTVVSSGSYVLLAVSRADVVTAALNAFKAEAGTVSDTNVFYRSANAGAEQ